jgi:hypothetical protein
MICDANPLLHNITPLITTASHIPDKLHFDTVMFSTSIHTFRTELRDWKGLQTPALLRELFGGCAEVSEQGVIPLRAYLIKVAIG